MVNELVEHRLQALSSSGNLSITNTTYTTPHYTSLTAAAGAPCMEYVCVFRSNDHTISHGKVCQCVHGKEFEHEQSVVFHHCFFLAQELYTHTTLNYFQCFAGS